MYLTTYSEQLRFHKTKNAVNAILLRNEKRNPY